MSARARVAVVGTAVSIAVATSCVEITAGPGGVQSIRMQRVPPSIIAGDVLRDTLGAEVRLQALAFDERGDAAPDAPFAYAFLPRPADTAYARPALTVDAASGAVRADTLPRPGTQRVSARLGDVLQVLDSLAVVRRPQRIARPDTTAAADSALTLSYLCTDNSRELRRDTLYATVSAPLAVRLTGDSGATSVPVPSYLVRYRITAFKPIPSGTSPYGDVRPALYVVSGSARTRADRPIAYDTTASDGRTAAQLRVVPTLLTASTAPDSVHVLATALVGTPLREAASVRFRVRFLRRTPSTGGCP